jgi:hypothetical protein
VSNGEQKGVTVTTYKDLKSLPIPKQAQTLLRRLAKFHTTSGNSFAAHNYAQQPDDLAHGFPRSEKTEAEDRPYDH